MSSSATGTTQSSSTRSPGTDLFAQDLAAAARSAQESAAAKAAAAQPRHTSPPPKPASIARSSTANKPKPADDAQRSDSDSAGKASNAGAKAKTSSAAQAAADARSGRDQSAANDAAQAANSDGNATANTASGPNGAKGKAPSRTGPKSNAPQGAAAMSAHDEDPSTDSTNQSGLSLLQLLAQSLEGDDADTPSTDTAAPAATDHSGTDGTDKTSDDPNAIALAMFTQALAAAFSGQQTPTVPAASAQTGDATTAMGAAIQSPGGAASMQDLSSVLAQDVAAGAKSKSDDGAAQFNIEPAKADASSTDTSAVGPNAVAQLGVASHFAAQHLRNDSNTGDLKSPVGSPAWQDEVGTQLTWMTQKGLETGSLRVSPEHLGPVEVNISVQNGDASVWFTANHPDTRAALEQALPRLREMFASQGMNLNDSGVSRQSPGHNGSRNQGRSTASQSISGVSAVGSTDSASVAVRMNLGLVDTYA